MKDHIVLVGLNHEVAPVAARERLAFKGEKLREALRRFSSQRGSSDHYGDEGVILSTCNRLEVYTVSRCPEEARDAACRLLEDCHGKPSDAFRRHSYTHTDERAAAHLFSVAAGLDSMVVGEHQILGQVTEAMEAALAENAAGKVLSALFRQAIEVGKRARTETSISQGTTSVSHAAVELAQKTVGNLCSKRTLLIGAGEAAELVAQALVKSGAGSLSVINRTREHAEELGEQFDARVFDWDQLEEKLSWADVVISSTGAPHTIVQPNHVHRENGRQRPLFLIDIAVPRDIDPNVAKIDNVHLYDIDDVEAMVKTNLSERRHEVSHVEDIVAEAEHTFMAWCRSLGVVPTIVELREQAHAMREAEVEQAFRRLPALADREQQIIQALTKRIVNKLLHRPTICLKEHAGGSNGHAYAEVARDLFGVDRKDG